MSKDNLICDGLQASLQKRGVKFLLASYVDMHGVPKCKMVPIDHMAQMVKGSELFCGAALDGVPQDVNDEEFSALPDTESCRVLPWNPEVAWFASDLWIRGARFESCSRNTLKRVLARAASLGFGMNLGMEAEFYVFEETPDGGFRPLSSRKNLDKAAYDTARLLDNLPWIGELVTMMNGLGWDVYSFDHEDGIGQFEIDFKYFDALAMSDNFVFFRWMAQEVARKHGGFATFMPKPYENRAGSGAHFNMSLYDIASKSNLFGDPKDPNGCNLAAIGYQFIAGVLRHLPAICAVIAPTVNSYKRLTLRGSLSGFTWAPIFCCYGGNNRTNTLRIPLAGERIELRAADSACNPYLGAAMVLAAGLEGIEQKLDPGKPHRENMYLKTPQELKALGVDMLPRTLEEALDAFAADPLSRAVFGDKLFNAWVAFKREEWLSYTNHVSSWEKDRYLRFF